MIKSKVKGTCGAVTEGLERKGVRLSRLRNKTLLPQSGRHQVAPRAELKLG